jgi:head-tail adaptor
MVYFPLSSGMIKRYQKNKTMEKKKVGRPKKQQTKKKNFKSFKENIIADFFTVHVANQIQLNQHLEFQDISLPSTKLKNNSFFIVVKRWLEITAIAKIDVDNENFNISFLEVIDEKNRDLSVELIQEKLSSYKK